MNGFFQWRQRLTSSKKAEKTIANGSLTTFCYGSGMAERNAVDERPPSKRSAIGDGIRRLLDQRGEQRQAGGFQTAVLNHRGHRHVVRVSDVSASGAMIVAQGDFVEGDEVVLQLLDHGSVTGQVRWVRDGRVGVNFDGPTRQAIDE